MTHYAFTALANGNRPHQFEPPQCEPPISKTPTHLNKWGHFVNGFLANANMVLAMQPVFALKTYRQSGKGIPPLSKLYHGLPVNILTGGPAEGITFLAHNIATKVFKGDAEHLTDAQNITASALSGATGAVAIAPCERVMIQQQLNQGSISAVMKPIIAREGWQKAALKGLVPTAGRDALYNCGIFALNEIAHRQLESVVTDKSQREVVASALCGAGIGFAGAPLDRVKTMMQASVGEENSSFLQTTKKIVAEGGIKALWKGGISRAGLIAGATYCVAKSKEEVPAYLPRFLFKEEK